MAPSMLRAVFLPCCLLLSLELASVAAMPALTSNGTTVPTATANGKSTTTSTKAKTSTTSDSDVDERQLFGDLGWVLPNVPVYSDTRTSSTPVPTVTVVATVVVGATPTAISPVTSAMVPAIPSPPSTPYTTFLLSQSLVGSTASSIAITMAPQTTPSKSTNPITTTASVIVPPVPTGPIAAAPAPAMKTPTVVGRCLPNCTISAENKCYATLPQAINAVKNGATISLASGAVLSGETATTKNIFLAGCEAGRSRVTVRMDSSHGGVIFATGKGQTVGFYKLSVQGAGMKNFSSLLRTPELGDGTHFNPPTTGPVSLFINDCDFYNFRTQARGGSVIFIGKSQAVSITNSEFRNNKCVIYKNKNRFDGGGAVWLLYMSGQGLVQNCQFTGNTHEFGHSTGAALMVLDIDGSSRLDVVDSHFQDNIADSGGALYFRDLKRGSVVNIDSRFVHNTCNYTATYGCRGGAAWIQNIAGQVFIAGTYENNEAMEDRGGVFANNRIHPTGRVVLSGTYLNNRCTKGSAVWDTLYGLERNGELTVLQHSIFQGNRGDAGRDIIIRLLYEKPTQEELDAGTATLPTASNETIADGTMRTIVRTETHWLESGQQWNFVGGTPNPTSELEF